jgi:hypothetical protein
MLDSGRLAPHERLLVKLVQRDGVRPSLEDDRATVQDAATRARLVRLAKEQGVHGLALSALVASPLLAALSVDVAKEIADMWNRLRRQAALWDMERDRVLAALGAAGLRPVTLKGAALREMVYRQSAERSMGDLDLLLLPAEIEPARAVLERLGYRSGGDEALESYRRHHFHFALAHPNGFVTEIHWALSRPRAGFRLDERQFLSRAVERPAPHGGPMLRVPSVEDMVLHLASQNQEDAFGRLRRLADLDRVVAGAPDLDWAYLRDAAKRGDTQKLLALSLRLCELLLRTPVPEGFIDSLALSRACRLNLAMMRPVEWVLHGPARRRAAPADALVFWTTVSWRDRLHGFRVKAWPHADPLARMWQGEGRPSDQPAPVWPLLKLAAYQAWILPRAVLGTLTPEGRRQWHFWHGPADDGSGGEIGKKLPRL